MVCPPETKRSIEREDLPLDRFVSFELLLSAAQREAGALSARITKVDGGRELQLSEPVMTHGSDRARIQVDRDWLSNGRYVIEIETGEHPNFLIWRYPLEIR